MKLPNSYGSVYKLTGKRRKPYVARVTIDCVYDEVKEDYIQKRKSIGTFKTKAEALEALAAYHDNPYGVLDADMSVQKLWDSIKDNLRVSHERSVVYNRLFDTYLSSISNMKIKDVKTKHLQQIIDECEKGYSTKSNLRALFHQIYNYAVQNDIVDKDYADYIKFESEATQIERSVYTSDEIKELWSKSDIEAYAMTLILIHQGMRLKEFRDMRTEDVDYDAMTINIPEAKNKYSIRTIPIHPKTLPLLKQLEKNGKYTEMNAKQYQYFVDNVFHHTAYDCRHTFATKAAELNLQTVAIQKIMGHKPDTLLEQVYTHLSIEDLSKVIKQIEY